jgi:hypothetical protein
MIPGPVVSGLPFDRDTPRMVTDINRKDRPPAHNRLPLRRCYPILSHAV